MAHCDCFSFWIDVVSNFGVLGILFLSWRAFDFFGERLLNAVCYIFIDFPFQINSSVVYFMIFEYYFQKLLTSNSFKTAFISLFLIIQLSDSNGCIPNMNKHFFAGVFQRVGLWSQVLVIVLLPCWYEISNRFLIFIKYIFMLIFIGK